MNPIQKTMAALRDKLERSTTTTKKGKQRPHREIFSTFVVEALEQRKMLAADTVINIDTFTDLDDMPVVSLSTRALETLNFSQSGLDDVIGGTRALSLTKTGGSLTASTALFKIPTEDSNGEAVDGKYSVSFGGAATDGFAVLDYGVYADAALELNQSFTTNSVIQLDLESNDLGGEFTVGLQDGAGSTATYSVPFARGVEGVVIEFPLHEFTGIDLNDIDGIQILTDPVAEADLVVDEIRVVVPPIPESPSLVVTTAADVVDVFDNETSLREAIAFANDVTAGLSADGDADNDGNANDTITFAGGIGEAFENGGTIRLTQGELVITAPLTIDAPNAADQRVIITGDANGDDVTDDDGITIVAESFGGTSGAADDLLDDNSRIFNVTSRTSPLLLDSLTLTGGRTIGETMKGGAIQSQSDVTLINSTVSGNSTAGQDSDGGGVSSFGTATLIDTLISNNSTLGDIAEGGGLIASTVFLNGSEITGNSTSGYRSRGGGFWADNATLAGSTVNGNGTTGDMSAGGGFYAADTATLTNTEVRDNSTSGNSAWGGGFGARTSIIEGSTVSGNSTSGDSARGGGFWTYDLTLTNSTISGNRTTGAVSVGGGFWTLDATLVGTTVSGNSTTGENARGGGILSLNTLNLTNSLILGNTTLFNGISGDDEVSLANGALTFEGQNLVGATPQTFDASAANVDNANPLDIFAATMELLDETGAGTGVSVGVLADNGGDVQTIALQDDLSNPAINSGDATAPISLDESVLQTDLNNDGDTDDTLTQVDELAFDARGAGFDRIFGSGIDLGAFEVNTPINQAPVAQDDDVTTDEDTSLTIDVLADNGNGADSDAENNLVIAATRLVGSAPALGELTNNNDGTFTFDPDGDFETLAADELELISFTYEIEDEFGETSQAQVNIQVTGANDAPIVQPLTAIADEEGPDVVVTADFVDADTSDSHGFTIDTTETLGTVVNNGDGTFSYNPNGAFDLAVGETGTDRFTYTVDDGNGGLVTETVTITILARDISIDKFTNGVDADNPEDAVAVQAGDIIDWTYVVTNTGQIAFDATEVIVTDDNGTPTITDDFSTLTGHIVLDASTDIGNDRILSAGESWTYTATGIAANINLESVTVEAEHMHRRRYRVVHGSQASGERLVRLNNNSSNRPGKLWSYFQGESGTYDLIATVQDENDGQSEIVVKVAGTEVGRIQLDQDTDGAGSNNGGFSEFTLEDIAIEGGDEFTLWVDGDGGELVRIDKLEFVAPTVFTMSVIDDSATIDYTLEAEDMARWNYRTRNANQASGGKIARLKRAGTDGDLTTTFDGESGSYSLSLFAQDENDGQSEVVVKVAGQEVGRIQLDQDNDGEGSDHGPFSEFTLTDIQVNQGDQITLWVEGDGGEYVRIDKLELSRPFVLNSIQSIASVTAGGSTSAVDSSNYVNQTTMSMSGESHFGYWCIDEVEIYADGYGDFADLYRFYDANGDLLVTVNRSDANFGWDWSVGAWELEWNASQIGFDAEQVFFVSAQNFGEVESGLLQIDRIEFS